MDWSWLAFVVGLVVGLVVGPIVAAVVFFGNSRPMGY